MSTFCWQVHAKSLSKSETAVVKAIDATSPIPSHAHGEFFVAC